MIAQRRVGSVRSMSEKKEDVVTACTAIPVPTQRRVRSSQSRRTGEQSQKVCSAVTRDVAARSACGQVSALSSEFHSGVLPALSRNSSCSKVFSPRI